jgi:hypothetical protein
MARLADGTGGSGTRRKGKAVLFQGSKQEKTVPTGDQWVRGAESRFKSTAVSGMGPTDAINARREKNGKKPATPFYQRQAQAAGRVAARIEERKAQREQDNGISRPAAGLPDQYAELATSLAQFDDDPVTQKLILDKWHANQAKKRKAAAAEKTPAAAGAGA